MTVHETARHVASRGKQEMHTIFVKNH